MTVTVTATLCRDGSAGAASSRARRWVLGGMVALVGAGLAGCTGDAHADNPSTSTQVSSTAELSPAPSPSPAVSVAPTPTVAEGPDDPAPVMPTAARKNTAAGARAAALYFLDVYNYALAHGDVHVLNTMCTDASTFCVNARKAMKQLHSGDASHDGGILTGELVTSYARDSLTGGIAVDVRVSQSRLIWRENGKKARETAASTHVARLELIFYDEAWHVVTLRQR